jgi:hypothetical protein
MQPGRRPTASHLQGRRASNQATLLAMYLFIFGLFVYTEHGGSTFLQNTQLPDYTVSREDKFLVCYCRSQEFETAFMVLTAVVMNRRFGGTCRLCLLPISGWFLVWLILRP